MAMVERALEAADALAADGIDAEVIDLRWLRPLDLDTVPRERRAHPGRLVVVEEQYHHGGWGATPDLAADDGGHRTGRRRRAR